jgi:DNA-binding XRE family transcriptional regulator
VFTASHIGQRANVPSHSRDLPSQIHRTSDRFTAERKAIGSRLRALRKARRWTQEKTAEHTGVETRHIQMIEAGELNVTVLTLVRLAEGFGVPLSAFFVDEPK